MRLVGGAQGLGIGVQQVLVANNEDALRQSRQMQIGALNALHDQATGGASQHLGTGKTHEREDDTSTSPEPRRQECGIGTQILARGME